MNIKGSMLKCSSLVARNPHEKAMALVLRARAVRYSSITSKLLEVTRKYWTIDQPAVSVSRTC